MAYVAGPFDSTHVYVQWGGKLPGNEQWSCGLRMYNATGGTLANDPAVLNAAAIAISAFHNRATSYISSSAKLSFVKANVIGTDGHYVAPTTLETVLADVPGGGSASNPYPNQVALAVSLVTGFSRGPAHRGRFYLPGVSEQDVDSVGVIAASKITEVQNNLNDFITAANGHRFFMCLIHKERAPKPGEEPLPVLPPTAVQSWRIDPLAATQRRRMRK